MELDQKTRDKIAVILSAILVPIMIILLVVNIGKARKRTRRPGAAKDAPATEAAVTPSPPVSLSQGLPPESTPEPLDPEVLKEQKRIAALLPKHNPFDASMRQKTTSTSPRTRARAKRRVVFRVDGIMGSKGNRMAVLNGKVLKVGETIEGWTVVEISSSGVILGDGTEKITLPVRR